jgi:ribonuclease Z
VIFRRLSDPVILASPFLTSPTHALGLAGTHQNLEYGSVSSEAIPIFGSSVAGVETAIEIPSLKLVLDMGRCSRTAVGQPLVVVSHGHLDHIGALTQHASRRAMMKMTVPTYLVPRAIVADVERLFDAAATLDGHPIARQIVGIEPGRPHALAGGRWIQAFETFHRVPSQGYTLWEHRHRLRPEFQGTPGAELAALKRRGVEVDETHDVPVLSFTGDTRVEVLERVPELQQTETLVIETTFLDRRVSVEDARAMGHIHLDEVLDRRGLLPRRDVVFSHVSARYGHAEMEGILATRLPDELRGVVRTLV